MELNAHLKKFGQSKLTFNDFILKAAVVAATRVPRVNASFAGDAVSEAVHEATGKAFGEAIHI